MRLTLLFTGSIYYNKSVPLLIWSCMAPCYIPVVHSQGRTRLVRVVYLAFHSGIVYNDIKDIRVIADKSEMQAFLVKLHSHTTHETSCHEAVVCSRLLVNHSWYFHEKYSSGCIENTKQPSFAEKGGTRI